VYIEEREREEI